VSLNLCFPCASGDEAFPRYYALERSVNNPNERPEYSFDADSMLAVITSDLVPRTLSPYAELMRTNLVELLCRCGFGDINEKDNYRDRCSYGSCINAWSGGTLRVSFSQDTYKTCYGYFRAEIKFPQKLGNGHGNGNGRAINGHSRKANATQYKFPEKLTVDDTFENANLGVRFAQILNGEDGDPQPPNSVSPTPAPGDGDAESKKEDGSSDSVDDDTESGVESVDGEEENGGK
jgi:hypothetical protein